MLALFGAVALLTSSLTRCALAFHAGMQGRVPAALLHGLLLDAGVVALALSPVALLLALGGGGWLRVRWFRFALVGAFVAALVFSGFVESFFFEEFDARFNHIALDYLLYPGEVAGNIWESYNVPLYAGIALLAGAVVARVVDSRLSAAAFPRLPWRARLTYAAIVPFVALTAGEALSSSVPFGSGNRRLDEIASNGLVQLVHAYETASLPYDSYYHTAPPSVVDSTVRSELDWLDSDSPQREFRAAVRRSRPLDIVIVLSESFGSEFVGRLGGAKPNAPGFERWANKGLLLTNVVPTGNRTVRGLEGVLCSFVPLPGDSIWKRDKSDGVATIAGVLAARGYRTEFVYGGDGSFDRMKSFALRNGWQTFHEDALIGASSYPEHAFRTVWGVADETMYAALLERQRTAAREGVPFFGTALTVSNHKPFLTPDSDKLGLRGDKLRTAGVVAVLLASVSFAAWRLLARRFRAALVSALCVLWAGFAIHTWTEAQARDSRAAAVRYADRAFERYMERAQAEGLLDHTVVLFVGDHGARVYGSEEIPAASYRVPALLVSPDEQFAGRTIETLCSQIDLAPTLLSLAGIDFVAPFFGRDLLKEDADGPGRAYLIHNRNIGLLTDTSLTVLGLQKSITCYSRSDRSSSVFVREPCDDRGAREADRAASVFETASRLYEARDYRLLDGP